MNQKRIDTYLWSDFYIERLKMHGWIGNAWYKSSVNTSYFIKCSLKTEASWCIIYTRYILNRGISARGALCGMRYHLFCAKGKEGRETG